MPYIAQGPRAAYMSAQPPHRININEACSHSGSLLGQSVLSVGLACHREASQPRRRLRKRGVGARSRGTLGTAPGMDPTTSARTRATIGACQASLGLIPEGAVISLGLIVSSVILVHSKILFILRKKGAIPCGCCF